MPLRRSRLRRWWVLAAGVLCLDCARLGYDPREALGIGGSSGTWLNGDAAPGPGQPDAGAPVDAASSGGFGASDAGTATSASRDAGRSGPVQTQADTGTEDADASAASPPTTCDASPVKVTLEPFDTDLAGWEMSSAEALPMNATWQASGGAPTANGVVRVDAEPGAASAFLNHPMPTTDLSGAVLSARIYLAAGANVSLKPYAQTGASYAWADGGRFWPESGRWLCVSWPLDSPDFQTANFDATEVVEVGMEFTGDGPVTFFVDEVRY